MEPPQIAVAVLGGDATPPAHNALDLTLAAVDRLDVRSAPDPLATRRVDTEVKRRRDGRIAAVRVGYEQGIAGDDRFQHRLLVLCVQRGQGVARGLPPRSVATRIGTCSREAALLGFATAPSRLAGELPFLRPVLQNEKVSSA